MGCISRAIISIAIVCLLVSLFISIIPYEAVSQAPAFNDGYAGWAYYREIVIKDNSNEGLNDYQVQIELNESTFPLNAMPDGSDLRFISGEGKELNYYIEQWDYPNKARIWVKSPAIQPNGNTSIFMLYGNPDAGSKSIPGSVFLWYDNFDTQKSYEFGEPPSDKNGSSNINFDTASSRLILSGYNSSIGIATPFNVKNVMIMTRCRASNWFAVAYGFNTEGTKEDKYGWSTTAKTTSPGFDRAERPMMIKHDSSGEHVIFSDNKPMSASDYYTVIVKTYGSYHEHIWPELNIRWTYNDTMDAFSSPVSIWASEGKENYTAEVDYLIISSYINPEPSYFILGEHELERISVSTTPTATISPTPIVVENDLPVIIVGEDKTFYDCNYHFAYFDNMTGKFGRALSEGNYAVVKYSRFTDGEDIAFADVGVKFRWDTGGRSWDDVKDIPLSVTIDYSYDIELGNSSSFIMVPGLLYTDDLDNASAGRDCYDVIRSGGLVEMHGTELVTLNKSMDGKTLTVGDIGDNISLKLIGLIDMGSSKPSGCNVNVTINSIKVDFPDEGLTLDDIKPVGAVVAGAGLIFIWQPLVKLFLFFYNGVKSYFQRYLSVIESRKRKITAMPETPVLFGLSFREILVFTISILFISIAFAYVNGSLLLPESVLLFVCAAGLTTLVHEAAHRYVSKRHNVTAELKFWDAGSVILFVTALIFNTPFSQPSRTIINDMDKTDLYRQGTISLAGPVASLILSVVFLGLIAYGNGLEEIGKQGFMVSMLACVYSLLPFEPMEGVRVFTWNKWAWGIVFIPSLVTYLWILMFVL